MKKKRNIIISALIIALLLMAVGYSSFTSELTINGNAEITGEWGVKITKVDIDFVSEGCDPGYPTFTNSTVTFDAKLEKPGDKVNYLITIENTGTIDATLASMAFVPDDMNGSPAIQYEIIGPDKDLPGGATTTLEVAATYLKDTTEVPEVKTKTLMGIIEYEQK